MKIVTVVGARPQFVKAATVSRVIAARPAVSEVLVHTGQHYDAQMSDVFFSELGIPAPAYHLGIGSAPHGAQTGRMLEAVEGVIEKERPDWLLVYGDTNSTLAGALAAVKMHVPVAHVEAGLRSFNRAMPEEINRVLTDHAADLLFAPTTTAVANLQNEGIPSGKVAQVGDVMYDAALHFRDQARASSAIRRTLNIEGRGYVLATIHRAENTDDPQRLAAIAAGLSEISRRMPVVLPLHPRTRQALGRQNIAVADTVRLIDPVSYLDMVMLEEGARLIVTDSGGVQKEAYFFKVPCVTLRDETEWVELVQCGWNRLVPPSDPAAVVRGIAGSLDDGAPSDWPAHLYGDGNSATLIANQLELRTRGR